MATIKNVLLHFKLVLQTLPLYSFQGKQVIVLPNDEFLEAIRNRILIASTQREKHKPYMCGIQGIFYISWNRLLDATPFHTKGGVVATQTSGLSCDNLCG